MVYYTYTCCLISILDEAMKRKLRFLVGNLFIGYNECYGIWIVKLAVRMYQWYFIYIYVKDEYGCFLKMLILKL